MRSRFVAEIEAAPGGLRAVDVFAADRPSVALGSGDLDAGTIATVRVHDGVAQVERELAPAGSARASLYGLLVEHDTDPTHPDDVLDEVQRWCADPGIDDPALLDLTAIPFVTVDGPGTRDLDQALHVEADGSGFLVRYAIADASYYVRPGTALWHEALRRGSSYYLPGLSVPMLPRALSEGLVSLGPGHDRRAMVFEMAVDRTGRCVQTKLRSARVRSRAQLTFAQVQALLDGEPGHGIDDPAIAQSLRCLQGVGNLRLRDAEERDVVRHRRREVSVKLADGAGMEFVVIGELRNGVELYSEQLSLLCNIVGARLLRQAHGDDVQPVYRTHAPPKAERLAQFERLVRAVTEGHGLDAAWHWRRGDESLADYVARLPMTGDHAAVSRALMRQAIMVNVRSSFSAEPGRHYGIGADVYARFSAPMREIVGVFVHKEAWEHVRGRREDHPDASDDDTLRAQVIAKANASKAKQRELTRAANLLVLDRLFGEDMALARSARPTRPGVVMGLTRSKLHVRLADPPVDVKLYLRHVNANRNATVTEDGASLVDGPDVLCRLGDRVHVRTVARDQDKWHLELV